MHYTREQLDTLLERAVTAVRSALGSPGDPMHLVEAREAAAQTAVTDAVRAGIHHRQIAERTGVSGLRVLGYITDVELSHAALRAERHHAERYMELVMDEIRGRALYMRLTEKVGKSAVCAALGIGRVTLNAWIASVGGEDEPPTEPGPRPRPDTHPTDLAKAARAGQIARRLREEQGQH